MDERVCKICGFYDIHTSFCRRYPPIPVSEYRTDYKTNRKRLFIVSKFPVIIKPEIDWCGEFDEVNNNK